MKNPQAFCCSFAELVLSDTFQNNFGPHFPAHVLLLYLMHVLAASLLATSRCQSWPWPVWTHPTHPRLGHRIHLVHGFAQSFATSKPADPNGRPRLKLPHVLKRPVVTKQRARDLYEQMKNT